MSSSILKTVIFLIKNIVNEDSACIREETEDLDALLLRLKSCNLNVVKIFIFINSKEEQVFDEYAYRSDETLIVTDCGALAKNYAENGFLVIGYIHKNNTFEEFTQITYIIEGFEELDINYFVKTFKRLKKIPWDILETERCKIREITEEDIDALYEIYKEPSITQYMEDLFEDLEEEREYIKNYISSIYGFYGYGMWIIELKKTGEIIGRGGLEQNEDTECLELGYMIAVPYQRQGYGKEVCSAILQYGYEELGATVIGTMIEEKNQASEALCRSLGFQFQMKVLKNNVDYKKFIWYK